MRLVQRARVQDDFLQVGADIPGVDERLRLYNRLHQRREDTGGFGGL